MLYSSGDLYVQVDFNWVLKISRRLWRAWFWRLSKPLWICHLSFNCLWFSTICRTITIVNFRICNWLEKTRLTQGPTQFCDGCALYGKFKLQPTVSKRKCYKITITHQNPFVPINFPNNSHQIPLVPINNPSKYFCSHQVPKQFPSNFSCSHQ